MFEFISLIVSDIAISPVLVSLGASTSGVIENALGLLIIAMLILVVVSKLLGLKSPSCICSYSWSSFNIKANIERKMMLLISSIIWLWCERKCDKKEWYTRETLSFASLCENC